MADVGITLEQAQAQLAAWLKASEQVAAGKSYQLANGFQCTRENAKYTQQQIAYWQRMVMRLTPTAQGGRKMFSRFFPIDT